MKELATVSAVAISVLCAAGARAQEVKPSYYLIGNSLTWDTVPSLLDGDVQWHVDCGKPLPYIYAHPEAPCVKNSTLWPEALKNKQYDFLSMQPHYGSTLATDTETMSKWIEMQPKATIIIHTGWARHAKRADEYASTDISGKLQHSRAYYNALQEALEKKFPGRTFRQTRCIELLAKIADDIKAGKAPLEKVADLHRDAVHMGLQTGRYMMHNAMRHALGQPPSAKGFEKIDPELKKYLDDVLKILDEPAEK